VLKMRECVSNKMLANQTAEKNERKVHGNKSLRFAANNILFPVLHQLNIIPNGSSKEADEKSKMTYGENSITKVDKQYLFKRNAESSYSFEQT